MKLPKHKIKFKTLDRLKSVCIAYRFLLDAFDEPENQHHSLLKEHAIEQAYHFNSKWLSGSKTISISAASALAFCQIWDIDFHFMENKSLAYVELQRIRDEIIQTSVSKNKIANTVIQYTTEHLNNH